MNVVTKCLAWLTSQERRRAKRYERLPLVAHYWDGGAPMAHEVRNINARGLFLLTEQRWYPGTLVMLLVQREDLPEPDPDRSIAVYSRVVRSGADGVGFSFILSHESDVNDKRPRHGASKKRLESFLNRLHADLG